MDDGRSSFASSPLHPDAFYNIDSNAGSSLASQAEDNYLFGAFGRGHDVIQQACDRALAEGRKSVGVLDCGAGSGFYLAVAATVAQGNGLGFFARGLTGGYEAASSPRVEEEACSQGIIASLAGASRGATERLEDMKLLQGCRLEQPLPGLDDENDRFDLIVSSWTLRHLADPCGAIEQWANLLRVGGQLICNQVYLSFLSKSGRWDDQEAFLKGLSAMSSDALDIQVDIQGCPFSLDDTETSGFDIALCCERRAPTPILFPVSFTGLISGPMVRLLLSSLRSVQLPLHAASKHGFVCSLQIRLPASVC